MKARANKLIPQKEEGLRRTWFRPNDIDDNLKTPSHQLWMCWQQWS